MFLFLTIRKQHILPLFGIPKSLHCVQVIFFAVPANFFGHELPIRKCSGVETDNYPSLLLTYMTFRLP